MMCIWIYSAHSHRFTRAPHSVSVNQLFYSNVNEAMYCTHKSAFWYCPYSSFGCFICTYERTIEARKMCARARTHYHWPKHASLCWRLHVCAHLVFAYSHFPRNVHITARTYTEQIRFVGVVKWKKHSHWAIGLKCHIPVGLSLWVSLVSSLLQFKNWVPLYARCFGSLSLSVLFVAVCANCLKSNRHIYCVDWCGGTVILCIHHTHRGPTNVWWGRCDSNLHIYFWRHLYRYTCTSITRGSGTNNQPGDVNLMRNYCSAARTEIFFFVFDFWRGGCGASVAYEL